MTEIKYQVSLEEWMLCPLLQWEEQITSWFEDRRRNYYSKKKKKNLLSYTKATAM